MGKYDDLKKRYPEYVSKNQLYVICRISKRSAKYLLDNGIIPCVDRGTKTWRYQVALKDIIEYLEKRDREGASFIPRGAMNVSPMWRSKSISYTKIRTTPPEIAAALENEVRQYFEYIFSDFPDVLTAYDLVEITGLSLSCLQRYLKKGAIKSLLVGQQHMIPKAYVLDFVSSKKFLGIESNSPDFNRVLGGFEIWQRAKSSQ